MAVSRGSVRHTLIEDLGAFAGSLLRPGRYTARATSAEKTAMEEAIRRRLGTKHVAAFPYARTGFHAVLDALRLPRGSEVLLTPITIGPMLEVIVSLGLRPLFVDIELDTFGPDLNDLANKLKRRPAAFLMTYLFGYVPPVANIVTMCNDAGTPLIEDFSHNIGASFDGRALGTFGSAGVYSASLLKYVDGYNGAFVVTNDAALAVNLVPATARLSPPDPRRIRSVIQRTLFWNAALNRQLFTVGTFPALRCLKGISPARFEKLLGPAIVLNINADRLPAYYFEDITGMQCRTIQRHLETLDSVVASRRECARLASEAWLDASGGSGVGCAACTSRPETFPTYWQFVIAVKDVPGARNALFRHGIETGTTNLMDLAHASGIELPQAKALKEKHIFIPLHSHLKRSHYRRMFETLREAGQI